ncbi:hypothetical protein BH24CHL6_BH24CHL6_02120 [soil metagenome]
MPGHRSTRIPSLLLALSLASMLLVACAAAAPATPPPGTPDAGQPQIRDNFAPSEEGPVADAESGLRDGALIVYTGRLKLEVAEIEPVVDAATSVVVGLGGYVAGSQEQNTAAQQSASVTYRVPAARWTEAIRALRALALRVVNEHTESAEVTAQVVDLDARIANLRASEAALQEIMTRAGTIDDVLKVQRELASVRGQIEQLTASRDQLRDQASYGTLAVTFESPVVAATVAQEGWQLGAEVDRALADLIRIGQAVTSVGIWLSVVVLPVLLPLAVLVLVAYRLRRRFVPGSPPPDPLRPSM